jgi:hypothetical protein
MNPSRNDPVQPVARRSWAWIAGTSALISSAVVGVGLFVRMSPFVFLAALFGAGLVAGAVSSRQAWLSGIIVGIPFAFSHITRTAAVEYGTPFAPWGQADFWMVCFHVALVSTGVAILGGLCGAYLWGDRFRPR